LTTSWFSTDLTPLVSWRSSPPVAIGRLVGRAHKVTTPFGIDVDHQALDVGVSQSAVFTLAVMVLSSMVVPALLAATLASFFISLAADFMAGAGLVTVVVVVVVPSELVVVFRSQPARTPAEAIAAMDRESSERRRIVFMGDPLSKLDIP
jgi:hypothetical protein